MFQSSLGKPGPELEQPGQAGHKPGLHTACPCLSWLQGLA